MFPGLFQDFMDLYMKFYNSLIISLTKDSQSGGREGGGGGGSQLACSQSGWTQDGILWVANFWFYVYEICAQNQWEHKSMRYYFRTPTLAVRVRLGQNSYLIFNSDIVKLVQRTNEGKAASIILLIFVLWGCFDCRLVRGSRVGQKVICRASWITSFFYCFG